MPLLRALAAPLLAAATVVCPPSECADVLVVLESAFEQALNGMGYWTFMDFRDTYNEHYLNKWGLFKWTGDDCSHAPTTTRMVC